MENIQIDGTKKKVLSIGDLHGISCWKTFGDIPDLLNESKNHTPQYFKYIFLGDYVDSFDVSNVEILHNLKEIIDFKKSYPDHVVLLLGNHDLQYLFSSNKLHGCSGYRPVAYFDLHEQFRNNRLLFQAAFQIDNYLWTHAGVHKGWYKFRFPYSSINIADDLNIAFEEYLVCMFDVGRARGGTNNVGGPFWCCRSEMKHKHLKGYHQIVGHTRCDDIITNKVDKNTTITYIDYIENGKHEPYVIEI